MSETEFVLWLQRHLTHAGTDPVPLGDDAAVVDWRNRSDCVVTTDLLADGVHFELRSTDPKRIGRKALGVNISDLAAMAAIPIAAVVSLLLPRPDANALARELMEGMQSLAREYSMHIVGGDTNCWDGPLVINVTALGTCTAQGPLRRDGAHVGDQILVTGRLGGSRLNKQFDFQPRVREALQLAESYSLSAGMDISDGLLLDLSRMTTASHCGALVDLEAIPISDDAIGWAQISGSGRSPRDHACTDGEDFELLLAVDPATAKRLLADQPLAVGLTAVGEFISQPGLWQYVDGRRTPLTVAGYDHLTQRSILKE